MKDTFLLCKEVMTSKTIEERQAFLPKLDVFYANDRLNDEEYAELVALTKPQEPPKTV